MNKTSSAFQGFIGQRRVVSQLQCQLAGATALGQPFPHARFQGPSGVGKTRLATALGRACGTDLINAMGYWKVWQLIGAMSLLKAGDFLFVDEAHALPPLVQEVLFKAIDELRVCPPHDGRSVRGLDQEVEIQPFTLLLATDRPGKLSNALLKRMALTVFLEMYSEDELEEIVFGRAKEMSLLISPRAARLIARVAGGLPRKAEHCLENVRRHAARSGQDEISVEHVRQFLQEDGVDEDGLDFQGRKYLNHLANSGSASLKALAMQLGVDAEYVEYQIEPQLRHRGLVKVDSGGRRLTDTGLARASKSTDHRTN